MGGEEDRRGRLRQPVTLVVEYDGAEDLLGDYTENLSQGGTFVRTDRELELGTKVHLLLSFPGLIRPIGVAGTVRWSRGSDSGSAGVGIEFDGYESDVRERLERILDAVARRDPTVIARVMRVLVCEDNPHVARLIRDGLASKRIGDDITFSFRVAQNGREGLELLQRETFDALIIDVYLPVMDGPSVIAAVRKNSNLRNLPIIAVSAGGPQARDDALRAGADFFLEKPMRLREILQSMRKLAGLAVE